MAKRFLSPLEYHKEEDVRKREKIKKEIILSYDKIVCSIASKQSIKNKVDFEDLYQVGRIGLLKAIESFDSTRKNKFSTYAYTKIRGEILHYLRDKEPAMKIPRKYWEAYPLIKKMQEKGKAREEIQSKLKISDFDYNLITLTRITTEYSQVKEQLSQDDQLLQKDKDKISIGNNLYEIVHCDKDNNSIGMNFCQLHRYAGIPKSTLFDWCKKGKGDTLLTPQGKRFQLAMSNNTKFKQKMKILRSQDWLSFFISLLVRPGKLRQHTIDRIYSFLVDIMIERQYLGNKG